MKKKQRGSILVEVLVAVIIFATALFSLVSFQSNLLRNRSVLNQKTYALALANNKMQTFREYTALTATAGAFAYTDITSGSTAVANNNANYTMAWTVTDATATTNVPANKTVTILVTWTDSTGTAHTTLATGAIGANGIIARIDPTLTGKTSRSL